MSIRFIISLLVFGRVGKTNSWIHIAGFRHRGPDSLFDHPYYVNGHRLHSNLAKFHPEYIKFVEDAMLVLFLLCVLITLLVVHRASCYRWEEKREKTRSRGTVGKITKFFYHSILREINCGTFWAAKTSHSGKKGILFFGCFWENNFAPIEISSRIWVAEKSFTLLTFRGRRGQHFSCSSSSLPFVFVMYRVFFRIRSKQLYSESAPTLERVVRRVEGCNWKQILVWDNVFGM